MKVETPLSEYGRLRLLRGGGAPLSRHRRLFQPDMRSRFRLQFRAMDKIFTRIV